jgi:hypothetical protein
MKQLRAFVTGLLLFAIVLVGALGIAWAVGAQYQAAPETTEAVANEAATADVGNLTAVDAPDYAQKFEDNETITNSTGATLQEGSDYDWNASTGEIRWYNTESVDDGESMSVDYTYTAKTEEARTARTILTVPVEIILPVGVLIAVAMSVAGLAVGLLTLFRDRSSSNPGSLDFTRR